MTGETETPDRTTLLINQNNNFMRYAHIYYKVIGAKNINLTIDLDVSNYLYNVTSRSYYLQ